MKQFNSQEEVLRYFSDLPYEALLEARHENHVPIPKQMGIYFWFLREEGFDKLSGKLPVIVRPPQSTFRIGDAYLVYYGYVGIDTSFKSVQNANNLQYYFQSTIPHKQLECNLECYSFLSCFRKTVSGLLCDDILAGQEEVKAFFHDYFRIYYLAYEATSPEEAAAASRAIKADFQLIQRALFSLNHSFGAISHPTTNEFVYDTDGLDVRFIVENRRFRAELTTLENLRQKFNLDMDAGRDLVEPRLFFEGKHQADT
ncbi:hypothetical protein [Telluribacter sp. SYSU D00476]|uniref:hypothetical protein n=1 Tax=Telluribacter sp. SYSU D00476 TaxID=2811430 RepID=UPI001FF555DC|nr:hypothetical protein [Telluribacter sp. SYSU D00476]